MVIDAIVDTGGDIVTGYFQGNFAAIARTFKLKRDTVVKVWRQFVATTVITSFQNLQQLACKILGEWLDDIGSVLVYLPTYSPELNPMELVFNKLKTILHRVDYQYLLRDNLHIAVYEALKQFTVSDMCGFYKHVDYIRLR